MRDYMREQQSIAFRSSTGDLYYYDNAARVLASVIVDRDNCFSRTGAGPVVSHAYNRELGSTRLRNGRPITRDCTCGVGRHVLKNWEFTGIIGIIVVTHSLSY